MAQIGPDRVALSAYTGAALRVSSRRRRAIGFSEDSPAAVIHFVIVTRREEMRSPVVTLLLGWAACRRGRVNVPLTHTRSAIFCPAP